MFVALAVVTIAGAVWRLWIRGVPDTTLPGLVISALSLSFMFYLWRAKLSAGRALGSNAVISDAQCSLACIKLSALVLAGSLLFLLAPGLWWVDAVAAIGLAALIGKEGVEMLRHRNESGACCAH